MNFKYKVRDQEGGVYTGFGIAFNKTAMVNELKEKGLIPLAVLKDTRIEIPKKNSVQLKDPTKATKKKSVLDINLGGSIIKPEELISFTRDLFGLFRAGVSLVGGINDLATQTKNRNFRDVLEEVSEDINAGNKLSDALERHPKVFPSIYTSSIRSGEEAGRLEIIFEKLISTMEHDLETTRMVKAALRYPIIVLSILAIAFIAIITLVLPKISGIFDKFGTDLPLPTRILIGVGNFGETYGAFIVLFVILSIVGLHFYKKTEKGAYVCDVIKLRIPIFGGISKKLALSKFASTLQTLYASGVVLPEALKSCATAVGNREIGRSLVNMSQETQAGRSLSEVLKEKRLYPPIVIRMIVMGEKTGNLEKMLGEVVIHYNRQIQHMTKNIGTMIEPLLTLMLGGMILVLAMGVFMPMWNTIKLFKH